MKDALRFAGNFILGAIGVLSTYAAMDEMMRILRERATAREADEIWNETVKLADKTA